MRRTKKQHFVMMFFLAASLSALVGVVEILVSRLAHCFCAWQRCGWQSE
jgi:hypothetical protein